MSEERTFRIGELARIGRVSPRTIDYYTQLKLLVPLQRSGGNYRLYGSDALRRLQQIKALQAQRFSLGEIAARLGASGGGPGADVVDRVRQIEAQLAEIQAELADLAPVTARQLGGEVREHVARTAGEALARALVLAQYLTLLVGEGRTGGL